LRVNLHVQSFDCLNNQRTIDAGSHGRQGWSRNEQKAVLLALVGIDRPSGDPDLQAIGRALLT